MTSTMVESYMTTDSSSGWFRLIAITKVQLQWTTLRSNVTSRIGTSSRGCRLRLKGLIIIWVEHCCRHMQQCSTHINGVRVTQLISMWVRGARIPHWHYMTSIEDEESELFSRGGSETNTAASPCTSGRTHCLTWCAASIASLGRRTTSSGRWRLPKEANPTPGHMLLSHHPTSPKHTTPQTHSYFHTNIHIKMSHTVKLQE